MTTLLTQGTHNQIVNLRSASKYKSKQMYGVLPNIIAEN